MKFLRGTLAMCMSYTIPLPFSPCLRPLDQQGHESGCVHSTVPACHCLRDQSDMKHRELAAGRWRSPAPGKGKLDRSSSWQAAFNMNAHCSVNTGEATRKWWAPECTNCFIAHVVRDREDASVYMRMRNCSRDITRKNILAILRTVTCLYAIGIGRRKYLHICAINVKARTNLSNRAITRVARYTCSNH